jgi:hypothetical protein
VSWRWHSPFGIIYPSAVIVAYLPADVPIHKICPDVKCTYGIRPISIGDRYLVRPDSGIKPFMTPSAHLVEKAWLDADAAGAQASSCTQEASNG